MIRFDQTTDPGTKLSEIELPITVFLPQQIAHFLKLSLNTHLVRDMLVVIYKEPNDIFSHYKPIVVVVKCQEGLPHCRELIRYFALYS